MISDSLHLETEEKGMMMDKSVVKMYTISTCSHCKRTKQFLDDHRIDYKYIDVDLLKGDRRAEVLEEVKRINPKRSFPTITVGDTVIVGFKEQELKEALNIS